MPILDTLNPHFALPDMGDYYYDAPDQQLFYQEIDKAVNPVHRKDAGKITAFKFYHENPPAVGKQGEAYTFDINLTDDEISGESVKGIKVDDGDTIGIKLKNISAGDSLENKTYLDRIINEAALMAQSMDADCSDARLTLRFAGIDAKELPHFSPMPANFIDNLDKEENVSIGSIKDSDDYIFSYYRSFMDCSESIKTAYDGSALNGTCYNYNRQLEKADFVKLNDGKYHQYFKGKDDKVYILLKDDTKGYDPTVIADAGLGRDTVVNAIARATDMRVVIDATQLTRTGNPIRSMFGTDPYGVGIGNEVHKFLDKFLDNYTQYTRAGYNYWGLDAYGRAIAAVYVKIDNQWVNLNKMVIINTNKTEVNKYNSAGSGTEVIDTTSYDYDHDKYADSIYKESSKFDDREQVQSAIFDALGNPKSADEFRDWTLTIGDVTLFVPPTSIRAFTQTKAERQPLIRAKGSMAKSATKNQKIIEMDLYFNEEHGINGFKLDTNTRPDGKGKDVTYWMNGLRALYAQFRVAPFLPIDNKYINEVLGIDAVTMLSFSCDTVPNFPKLIKATLQLSEFEYRVYMPEIPKDDGDDDEEGSGKLRNYFSKQINYPLLRYYYQRLIKNGEEIKNCKFLDDKYISSTFGNKTCLVPMEFKSPYVKFYVPNKDQLEKLKGQKMERLANPGKSYKLDEKSMSWANDLSKVQNEVNYMQNSNTQLAELNSYLKSMPDNLMICKDGNNFKVIDSSKGVKTKEAQNVEDHIRLVLSSVAVDCAEGLQQVKSKEGAYICQGKANMYYEYSETPAARKNKDTIIHTTMDGDETILSYVVAQPVSFPNISEIEQKSLKTLATERAGGNFSADEVMEDGKLRIPFSIKFGLTDIGEYGVSLGQDDCAYFYVDNTRDVGFLNVAAEVCEDGDVGGNAAANANLSIVTKNQLTFEPYNEDEDFLVESIHINTSNTFSQITLQETNGFAPQYMGGTDVSINISMYTQSEKAAAAMHALPDISAEYARRYRLVLAAWPLKIESELTKMFGITDTMIETVQVDTVPNFPGLYHIVMSLVSMDRTMRNREALSKKDLDNFHNLTKEGVATERQWVYKKMNDFLSTAELYPDLELPTIKELADNGFNFIRYSKEDRIYPDPDFYFTYSHVLMSEIVREAVLNALNSDVSESVIKDSTGKQLRGKLTQDIGSYEANFELEKGWERSIQDAFTNSDDLLAARVVMDFVHPTEATREELWTIAPNVKVALGEKRIINYISEDLKRSLQIEHGQTPVTTAEVDPNQVVTKPSSSPSETGKTEGVPQTKDAKDTSANQDAPKDTAKEGSEKKAENKGPQINKEEANSKYGSAIAAKYQTVLNNLSTQISAILEKPVEDMNMTSDVKEIYKCFTPSKGLVTDNEEDDIDDMPYNAGMMNKWLTAAADAICSNGNQPYSPSFSDLTGRAGRVAQTAVTGASAGTAAGATIGSVVPVVGTAVGAGVGAAVGSVAGAVYGMMDNPEEDHAGAAWKFKKNRHARVADGGMFKYIEFSPSDDDKPYPGEKDTTYLQKVIYDAVEFGYFNFKFYSEDELYSRFGELGKLEKEDGTSCRGNGRWGGAYLADPYYRFQPHEKQEEYVKKCTTDFSFAKKAFLRICILYLRVLISYDVFPSYSYDVFRDAVDNKERMMQIISKVEEKEKEKVKAKYEASQKAKTTPTSDAWLNGKKKEIDPHQQEVFGGVNQVYRPTKPSKIVIQNLDTSDRGTSPAQKDNKDKDKDNQKPKTEKKVTEDAEAAEKFEKEQEEAKAEQLRAEVEEYSKHFKKNKAAVDNGKMFLAMVMGVCDGSPELMKLLVSRDYAALNAIAFAGKSPSSIINPITNKLYSSSIRTFIRAMAGENIIDAGQIGTGGTESPQDVMIQMNARANVAAASEDPAMYMVHSFYDMVVHDCRGRMLRAFPTFYFCMIDEGRKIGKWRLHDNFYNVTAISSITISKSRKMPTDTAEVEMTNFYQTYTTSDETLNNNYTANFTDVFDSLFIPNLGEYAEKEENKRKNSADPEHIRIRPGARIHIRIGYGADASSLPIVFNGLVAEADTSDTVKLICQGDGHEIAKPIMFDKQAYQMPGVDEWVGFSTWGENGITPKSLMRSLLNCKGGAINNYMHEKGYDETANLIGMQVNPLGIYHFGNPDINICGEAETMQNIFEICNDNYAKRYLSEDPKNVSQSDKFTNGAKSYWNDAMGEKPVEAPEITFDVFGKSVWDCLHICKSVSPEYYADVLPFFMRSTVFMGRSHDYYAYDYTNIDGHWYEKRKPYQQCHIYDSCTDIINNSLKVSTKDIKTCAVGVYEVPGFMNSKVVKRTDPQWVDKSIYPEYQRTMTVDTKLYGEPSRTLGILSDAGNAIIGNTISNYLDRAFDTQGSVHSANKIAVLMTIDALKQQMKEMYQGQITIIGDPTVKPNDRIILNDTYNFIGGQCLVRDVVHVFSADAGFKTVLTPDLITAQPGKAAEEEMKRNTLGQIACNAATGAIMAYTVKGLYNKTSQFMSKVLSNEHLQKAKKWTSAKGSRTLKKVKKTSVLKGLKKDSSFLNKVFSAGKKFFKGAEKAEELLKAGWQLKRLATIPLTIATTLGLGAAEDIISEGIKSRKRLVIFPLQKYGKPLVGGIDGNVGIVYGAPNFNSKDSLQTILGKCENKLKEFSPAAFEAFDMLFGEDGFMPIAEGYRMSELDKIANEEGMQQRVYRQVNQCEAEDFRNTYFNPAKTRVTVMTESKIKALQEQYGIKEATQEGINNCSTIKMMKYIPGDSRLKDFINLGFFRIAAYEKGFTPELSDKIRCMCIKDPKKESYMYVNALVDESNGTVDIPFLNEDAEGVLCEVVKRSLSYMAGTEQMRDPKEWYERNKDSFITVTSALKAGSTKNLENTGFSFVITASDDKSLKALTEAVDSVNKEMKMAHAKKNSVPDKVMAKNVKGQEVFIVVYPPEV